MRVFAGPNGSGKSTIIRIVKDNNVNLGVYCNADDYKRDINTFHRFSFASCDLIVDPSDFRKSFEDSLLFAKADGETMLNEAEITSEGLSFASGYEVNDYFTSFLCGYVRSCLLAKGCPKFTFETVMSHTSKLDFMLNAKEKGYKVYLYFVSLNSPSLNVQRVKSRVLQGGHDVPEDKIMERYGRTMANLYDAMLIADTSYIFDNSYKEPSLFATAEDQKLEILSKTVPLWFDEYVLSKL